MKTMLLCDVCAKPQQVLLVRQSWSVCNCCFEQADILAQADGRWLDDTDFARLRRKNVSGVAR